MIQCFQHGDSGGGDAGLKRDRRVDDGDDRDVEIVCAACEHVLTSARARIEMDGSHVHDRENPHGFRFQFACFDAAPGCRPIGNQSAEHTWFPGYRWQLDYCRGCGAHLGWMFVSSGHRFHALIVDRVHERPAR